MPGGPAYPDDTMMVKSSEMDRIRRLASTKVFKSDREKDRDARRISSQAREAAWPNTLAAQRKNKLDQRVKREEAAEMARLKVDAMEEARRQAARKKSIDRANNLLYEQKDLMKRFRSQQMLSDIIYEQKLQVDAVAFKKTVNQKRDEYFHREAMRLREDGIAAEKRKVERAVRQAKAVAAEQQEQLKEYTKAHLEKMVKQRMEGKLILEKAKRNAIEDAEKKEARRRAARQNNFDMSRANDELKSMNAVFAQKLAIETATIKRYADDKDYQDKRRKAHMIKKSAHKQAKVQRMIDRATEHLNSMQNNSEARLASQIAEKRAKDDAEHERKEQYRRDMVVAIDKSRQLQLDRKERDRKRDISEDKAMVSAWREQNRQMNEQAERERLQRLKVATGVQTFQGDQIAEIKKRRKISKAKALKIAKAKAKATVDEEDAVLVQVRREIDIYAQEGKNIKTMQNSLVPKDEIKGFVFY